MAKKQSKTFTREEVVAAVADAYRREQDKYHRLAQRAQEAWGRGEEALYTMRDDEAVRQECALNAVRRVADALGIPEEELNIAANSEKGCG